MSSRAKWIAGLVLALPLPQRIVSFTTGCQDGLDAHVRALVAGEQQALDAWRALADAGPAGARAALVGFESAEPVGRRLRARLVREHGDAGAIVRVLELSGDPDAEVRASWIEFLARPDLATAELEARIGALQERAAGDGLARLRTAALEALGTIDDARSVAALGRLVRELPSPERAVAAAALPRTSRSREVVRELALAGFGPGGADGARTPDDVLAAILPIHGHLLADEVRGAVSARDGAILLLGVRHPTNAVRRAADRAFETLLARLREQGRGEHALRLLADLERYGIRARVLHYHRARLAFFPAGDAQAALESARRLREQEGGAPVGEDERVGRGLWLFRSLYLEGMAELALGRVPQARARLEESAAVLDGQLAERLDRADERSSARHVDTLHQRALAEVALLLCTLVENELPTSAPVLERARAAHVLALEAQSIHAATTGDALSGWDGLLDSELSPYRLLFTGLALPAIDRERSLGLQAVLGRVLATVAPREVPGFVPFAVDSQVLSDPIVDPERLGQLQAIKRNQLEGVVREIERIQARVARLRVGVVPEEDIEILDSLDLRRRVIQRDLLQGDRDGWRALLELRIPGSMALWIARDLRGEGRGAESREYAARMKADLERFGIGGGWYWLGQERLARADMAIGNAWTDEDEPRKAEESLMAAVQRLEDIERQLTERGASEGFVRPFRALRSSALVSLAVNANVRLGAPDRALEYYEEAYTLRSDDFMRVLLACYRARSGRAEEARALLREIHPGPGTLYNMACTYALLGDAEVALDFLERELEENHPSVGSRERQMEWAAKDPDLASLRGDPRFEKLVGRR
ncbi:MAG: hypothetical protein GY711_08430 [bacterium]|nr:hypothetical protein [bacterium]